VLCLELDDRVKSDPKGSLFIVEARRVAFRIQCRPVSLCYNPIMTREQLLERIWIDPKRCFGKPCIRGHRIWVSLILDLLASGMETAEILSQYPQLEEADVLACIAYGSEMARERYVDIPLEAPV
jgi:uncharacterized protein (DUF433 family)